MKKSSKIIIIMMEVLLILILCGCLIYFLNPYVLGNRGEKIVEEVNGIPIGTIGTKEDAASDKILESGSAALMEEPASGDESAAESVTEAVTEPATESASESLAEAVTEPATESASESLAEAVTEPATESASESLAEAVTESSTEVTSENDSEISAETASDSETKESDVSASQETMQDHKAPIFLTFTAASQIKLGSGAFDVHRYVGYADDIDRDVDIEVSGNVDVNTAGTYTLKITLTDDAGNKTSKNMEVKVVESVQSENQDEKKREEFSDFVKNYKTDETCVGIDVSKWQGSVDFEKVKAAGCEFVYMRLGGYDNGEHYIDKYYKQNLAGAKAAGLKIGIYWHAEESSPEEIKASVGYLMEVLNGEKLDFPIAYDWEDYRNFETYGMNLQDLNACFDNFEKEVEKYGYFACLYGSKYFQENIWSNQKKNPIWLANYTSTTSYAGEYFMWQHSNTGRIDGINGDVDLDILYPEKLEDIR